MIRMNITGGRRRQSSLQIIRLSKISEIISRDKHLLK